MLHVCCLINGQGPTCISVMYNVQLHNFLILIINLKGFGIRLCICPFTWVDWPDIWLQTARQRSWEKSQCVSSFVLWRNCRYPFLHVIYVNYYVNVHVHVHCICISSWLSPFRRVTVNGHATFSSSIFKYSSFEIALIFVAKLYYMYMYMYICCQILDNILYCSKNTLD